MLPFQGIVLVEQQDWFISSVSSKIMEELDAGTVVIHCTNVYIVVTCYL